MDPNTKQQAVEYIKQASNVLVTVSTNPTVDQLSAALGMTLMLNKMGKHATAVFSGAIPPAISFLDPKKTFTNSVDGLRDFIIALDKEKADKLRYKVEDNVVRIFITPYDGEITKDDLQFSQGDFNVDVVVALGVTSKDDLDTSIKAHGRILHDATVVTINAGSKKSNIGAVDWQDVGASCLSEMIVSVSEAFQGGLLDGQIATALLTGIDASTERFSNAKTSPKVMTMAAQLMAAGANQQEIANNLTPPAAQKQGGAATPPPPPPPPKEDASELKLDHGDNGAAAVPPMAPPPPPPPMPEPAPSPQMTPAGNPLPPMPEPAAPPAQPMPPPALPPMGPPAPMAPPPQPMPAPMAPAANELQLPQAPPPLPPIQPSPSAQAAAGVMPTPMAPPMPPGPQPGAKSLDQIEQEIESLTANPLGAAAPKIQKNTQARLPDPVPDGEPSPEEADARHPAGSLIGKAKGSGPRVNDNDKPMLGGTFNATSSDAHDESEREMRNGVNTALLDHPDKKKKPDESKIVPEALATVLPDPKPEAPEQSSGLDVDAARQEVLDAMSNDNFDPSNNPLEAIGAAPMEGSGSTGIDHAAVPPVNPPAPSPPATETLAIPGMGAPQPTGVPQQASDSLDGPPMPPTPNPPKL